MVKRKKDEDLNEKIEVLKQELQLFPKYEAIVQRKYMNPIMTIQEELGGLARKEQRSGSTSAGVYREKKTKLISDRDQLEKSMLDSIEGKLVRRINEELSSLTEHDRDLIIERYKYKKSYTELAGIYHYSKSMMQVKIESILRMIARKR